MSHSLLRYAMPSFAMTPLGYKYRSRRGGFVARCFIHQSAEGKVRFADDFAPLVVILARFTGREVSCVDRVAPVFCDTA